MSDLAGKTMRATSMDGREAPRLYHSIEQEYDLLQNGAGLIDWMQEAFLSVVGPDAANFLQGMVTADIQGIGPKSSAPAWILDANGKILALVRIHQTERNAFLIQTPPNLAERIQQILDKYIIMEKVELAVANELACLSLQGPLSESLAAEFEAPDYIRARHDRCGQGGVDLIAERGLLANAANKLIGRGCRPIGLDAFNISRVESFIPRFEYDITPGENPLVYGLADRISHKKGCYIGQETVAMTRDRGHPSRLMVLLSTEGPTLPPTGTPLLVSEKNVGVTTTSVTSPKFKANLAIAVIGFRSAREGALLVDPSGQRWQVLRISAYKA